MSCYCGVGDDYLTCCLPLHTGKTNATTAVQLMRSRYSAFVANELDYLKRTMRHKSDFSISKTRIWLKQVKWQKLTVLAVAEQANTAYVTFTAYYLEAKQPQTLHEKSYFEKISGQWFYVGAAK